MEKQKIKIVRKNDEYSAEYQVGDVFQVDSTWYGGVNVTSASGIPLSLDKDEYVLLEEAEKEQPIDNYSYQCGVMDCFCEMVASGLKKLAMSHPCDTKAERDSYLPQVKKLCEKYDIVGDLKRKVAESYRSLCHISTFQIASYAISTLCGMALIVMILLQLRIWTTMGYL